MRVGETSHDNAYDNDPVDHRGGASYHAANNNNSYRILSRIR